MREGLADDDGARRAQQRHAVGVGRGPVPKEVRRAHGGGHVAGIDVVLDGDGDAVQRPAHLAAGPLGVQRAGGGQGGVGVHVHEGVQLRVQALDGRRRVAHQRFGVERALAHGVLQFGHGAAGEKAGFDGQRRNGVGLRIHRVAPW